MTDQPSPEGVVSNIADRVRSGEKPLETLRSIARNIRLLASDPKHDRSQATQITRDVLIAWLAEIAANAIQAHLDEGADLASSHIHEGIERSRQMQAHVLNVLQAVADAAQTPEH